MEPHAGHLHFQNLNKMEITLKSISENLPKEGPSYLKKINNWLKNYPKTIVVLDDDPTGCQTVHDIPVLTTWSIEALQSEFESNISLFFILTNTRSLPEDEAVTLTRNIADNLKKAASNAGKEFNVISRSDSTLRGHYPAEINTLKNTLELQDAVEIIVPAFFDGGRYTANGLHYVEDKGKLIPAALTPFAKDMSFGYNNSSLDKWIEEKTQGNITASEVIILTIEKIRTHSPEALSSFFSSIKKSSICTIDALVASDLEKVALAIHMAEKDGYQFIFRTAATFVQVYGGITEIPLLSKSELSFNNNPGLIIVGSYVPKTSFQLNYLINNNPSLSKIEIDAQKLISTEAEIEIQRCIAAIQSGFKKGNTILLYTSRKLLTANNSKNQLTNGQKISAGLIAVVKNLDVNPGYILAKGGITSNDIATKALGIKRAIVKGQLLPGVPVWETSFESKYPGIPYIVFPGNVGNEESLFEACMKLK